MKKHILVAFLLTILLTTACNSSNIETDVIADQNVPQETLPSAETAAPNCLGDEVSLIGESIADEYESASYEQIMTWFCNGAEFEDILIALETAEQTDTQVDEMLKMLANDFTWDEIWQSIGLTK